MKHGISTFPLPVSNEDNVKMVEREFGIKGFAVVVKLWQYIHSCGYYVKWDIDTQLLFIDEYKLESVGRSAVSEIVACCVRRGVFNKELFDEQNILTSSWIQETFLTATKRSKEVIIDARYALPIVYTFIENVSKNGKNVNILLKNVDISKQRKGKERKEKETPLPPTNGGGADGARERFFSLYPTIQQNAKDEGIDYEKLLTAFGKSEFLRRSKYLSYVVKNYERIIAGEFEDFTAKKDEMPSEDERAARERFYAERQHKEEDRLRAVTDKANCFAEYREGSRKLRELQPKLARAEVEGDQTLIEEIEAEMVSAQNLRAIGLKKAGLKESDVAPKYVCKKCSDTGWLADGKACDCYIRGGVLSARHVRRGDSVPN